MFHVYGATINGDRFFLKRKELLKENLKIILAEKRRLEMSSSGI
jgi:septum formation topological specificity factor MinE